MNASPVLTKTETTPEPWKAVVLYSDTQSGTAAQHLLSRVANRTESGGAWKTELWRFDVLADPPAADLALKDANDAQLIFLSARAMTEPPAWLFNWLNAWAQGRRDKSAAVAAWCHHGKDQSPPPAMEQLRDFAHQNGLNFLCADDYRSGISGHQLLPAA